MSNSHLMAACCCLRIIGTPAANGFGAYWTGGTTWTHFQSIPALDPIDGGFVIHKDSAGRHIIGGRWNELQFPTPTRFGRAWRNTPGGLTFNVLDGLHPIEFYDGNSINGPRSTIRAMHSFGGIVYAGGREVYKPPLVSEFWQSFIMGFPEAGGPSFQLGGNFRIENPGPNDGFGTINALNTHAVTPPSGIPETHLFAGGSFNRIDGQPFGVLASAAISGPNAGFWTDHNYPSSSDGARVNAITTWQGQIVAGGFFGAGQSQVRLIDFSALGSEIVGEVFTLFVCDGVLFAGGLDLIQPGNHLAKFSGTSWQPVALPNAFIGPFTVQPSTVLCAGVRDGKAVIGTISSGAYLSMNAGQSWQSIGGRAQDFLSIFHPFRGIDFL